MAYDPLVLTRRPSATRETYSEYAARGGYSALRHAVAHESPEAIRAMVSAADLRGRGGAGFPAARKWDLTRSAVSERKYLVANGGEHEPGSRKDRTLVTQHPHAVLEGMALAAHATGATDGYVYLIEDMSDAIAAARAAIDEAHDAGMLGARVAGSALAFDVEIATGPPTYVAGEETALLEAIEGRKALPRKKPPYPGERGLFGMPTTVNNVETLAFVPAIVRDGGAAWRTAGLRGCVGAMLFTLENGVANPGIYELPLGTTFRELIFGVGGGPSKGRGVRGFLPALSSAFLGADALDVLADATHVKAAGSNLGCGGVSVLQEGECVVERALEIAEFFKREQCGQCPPCRMETNTLAAVVKQVKGGTEGDYRAQVEKIIAFARGKGLCSLIEMAAAPIASALRLFPEDFAAHATTGRCASST